MRIILKTLGGVDDDIMEELRKSVNLVFGCPVEVRTGFNYLAHAYNPERKQYLSPNLLHHLSTPLREKNEKTVGVADIDLYAPRLNFVFGQADISSETALVSLCRLRQEYYGLPTDEARLIERATKEIVHELGHTFGLEHCPNQKCVMHFSNCLADTDYKELSFCSECRPKMILVT